MNNSTVNTQNHCAYSIYYHLVIVTKYRRKVLSDDMLVLLEQLCRERALEWEGEVHEINAEADHIHILLTIPPKHAIADFVNALKTGTSRRLRNTFPEQVAKFYRKSVFWSRSYFVATCGGAPLEVIKQYIQQQERPE